MKIENSNVLMQSNLESEKKHSSSVVKFEIKRGLSQVLQENACKAHTATELLLSTDFRSEKTNCTRAVYGYEDQMSSKEQITKQVVENLISLTFNKKQNIFIYPQKRMDQNLQNSAITIETKEEYYQKQTVDFHSSLQIQTPNNNYNMDLQVSYSKELYESHSLELKFGDTAYLDPLVINYDDDINPFDNLSSLKFEFDLNNDGENELIPLLKQGAGFLTYDKNDNGEIDNGSELFGPTTNNGFQELAQYDQDNNNWIDENDSIYDKLKVWQINEDGKNQLVSLVDLNVGAIYLGNVQSGFSYQNKIDKVDAVQKSNGIYIKNDGTGVRIINALDIAL